MTLPVTITDRFRAAWRAFNQNTKADPDALTKYMAAREAERTASLDKLDGYDKAIVRSIASRTANWDTLLQQVMPKIEQLDTDDQMHIMMHICRGKPYSVPHPAMRAWTAKRDNHTAVTRLAAKGSSTVIVMAE
jgi:hypothetical protein